LRIRIRTKTISSNRKLDRVWGRGGGRGRACVLELASVWKREIKLDIAEIENASVYKLN
jgi:hypothetical protein